MHPAPNDEPEQIPVADSSPSTTQNVSKRAIPRNAWLSRPTNFVMEVEVCDVVGVWVRWGVVVGVIDSFIYLGYIFI